MPRAIAIQRAEDGEGMLSITPIGAATALVLRGEDQERRTSERPKTNAIAEVRARRHLLARLASPIA